MSVWLNYLRIKIYIKYEKEDKLYDFNYGKSTGLLRKKRTQKVLQEEVQSIQKESVKAPETGNDNNNTRRENDSDSQSNVSINSRPQSSGSEYSVGRDIKVSERGDSTTLSEHEAQRESGRTAVGFIIALLAFTSLISGFMAKESVVSVMELLFTNGVQEIGKLAAASMLVFSLLYTPCVAAIASIKREMGRQWAVYVVLMQCGIAWIAALAVRLIGLAIGMG